jgi:predicted Na+-dependent transporter
LEVRVAQELLGSIYKLSAHRREQSFERLLAHGNRTGAGGHRVDVRELPYVVQLFALQILPFYGARLLRKWRPVRAAQLSRPAQGTAIVAMFVLLLYLTAHHALHSILSFGLRGWLAVLTFGVALLILGWMVGGRDAATRRTFAIAGEARNLALALVIANMTIGDDQVLMAIFGAWVILFALGWVAVGLIRASRAPAFPPVSVTAGG